MLIEELSGKDEKMEQQKWLDEALYEYGRKDYYPFHMPGHKREFCPGTLKTLIWLT